MRKSSINKRSALLAAGLALSLAVPAASVMAQAPVVEPRPSTEREQPPLLPLPGARCEAASSPSEREQARTPPGEQAETLPFRPPVLETDDRTPSAPGSMGELVVQLQQLQQEVMMLRGQVESQQNAIRRLEREQRERYLDLDRRIARGGGAGPELLPEPGTGEFPATGGAADERAAYEAAFALTRERRFEAAIEAFQDVIAEYPGGEFEGNSWYWLGELYLALDEPDLEQSRQAFVQVLERWPDHQKIPDTLYKLGVVYDQLGEEAVARRHLEQVRREHGGSSAARLAAGYLDRI